MRRFEPCRPSQDPELRQSNPAEPGLQIHPAAGPAQLMVRRIAPGRERARLWLAASADRISIDAANAAPGN
jgi:hypothetical protein